jgi:Uma2 family endonuclease
MSTADVLTPLPQIVHDVENRDHYEIIDGVKVEMPPMSVDSQLLASRLARHLSNFGVPKDIGEACTEVLFKLPLTKERNRKPDVAFVMYKQWPKNKPFPTTNAWEVLPVICVEVVSLNDVADEIETKINEYFEAGVTLVWIVYPRQERFYVYDSPAQVRRLTRADTLDGGSVLPDFRLQLTELFLPQPPQPK